MWSQGSTQPWEQVAVRRGNSSKRGSKFHQDCWTEGGETLLFIRIHRGSAFMSFSVLMLAFTELGRQEKRPLRFQAVSEPDVSPFENSREERYWRNVSEWGELCML